MNKKLIALMAGLGSILLNVGALTSATIAWFSSRKIADVKGIEVSTVEADQLTINNYWVVYWDEKAQTSKMSTNDSAAMTLDTYDTLITSRNDKLARYAVFDLTFNADYASTYYLTSSIKATLSTVDVDNGYTEEVEGVKYVAKKITNVIQFKGMFLDSAPTASSYDSLQTSFSAIDNRQTFVDESNLNDDDATIEDVASGKITNLVMASQLGANITAGTHKYYAIEFDYSFPLTTFFTLNYNGASGSALTEFTADAVQLTNDINAYLFSVLDTDTSTSFD